MKYTKVLIRSTELSSYIAILLNCIRISRMAGIIYLNKNSLAVKMREANQKQHALNGYKQSKTLISSKAKK